nr:hypothetical protein [Brucella intermedia]
MCSHPSDETWAQQIFGKIDTLQVFQPVEQTVGRRRVRARLELTQPHEAGHPIVSRFFEQCQ